MALTPEKLAEDEKWLINHGFAKSGQIWEKHQVSVYRSGDWWYADLIRREGYGETPEAALRVVREQANNVRAILTATIALVDEILGPRKEPSSVTEQL